MLRSFRDPEAQALVRGVPSARLPASLQAIARRRLVILDCAIRLDDLRHVPGLCLETHAGGSHKGYHSVRLDERWHLYFWWMDGDAYKIEIGPAPG